jgi:hypothetical protein
MDFIIIYRKQDGTLDVWWLSATTIFPMNFVGQQQIDEFFETFPELNELTTQGLGIINSQAEGRLEYVHVESTIDWWTVMEPVQTAYRRIPKSDEDAVIVGQIRDELYQKVQEYWDKDRKNPALN